MLRDDQHVRVFRLLYMRIKDHRGQGGQDPRPRTQCVVRDVEPQHGEQAVPLIACAEDPLRDVTPAAGFRSGIPESPPLQPEIDHKRQDRQRPERLRRQRPRKIRKECRDITRVVSRRHAHLRKFPHQAAHAANRRHTVPGHSDHNSHLQHELEEVGPKHAPQSTQCHVDSRERHQEQNTNGQRGTLADSQRRGDDAGHCLGHPAENQAIHQQAQVQCAKAPQKSRGLAGIADFGELHVRQQPRPPPQAREEKHRHHAGGKEAPPKPVARNPLPVDESRDHQRRVRSERRRHHARSRQPPRHAAAGNKIIFRALPGTPAEVKSQKKRDEEVAADGQPVEERERQGGLSRP